MAMVGRALMVMMVGMVMLVLFFGHFFAETMTFTVINTVKSD